jgi:hypothetical protein
VVRFSAASSGRAGVPNRWTSSATRQLDRCASRAPASRIANGRPPQRRSRSVVASAPASTRSPAIRASRVTASDSSNTGNDSGYTPSRPDRRGRLITSTKLARRGRQQVADLGAGGGVVQDHQHPALGDLVTPPVDPLVELGRYGVGLDAEPAQQEQRRGSRVERLPIAVPVQIDIQMRVRVLVAQQARDVVTDLGQWAHLFRFFMPDRDARYTAVSDEVFTRDGILATAASTERVRRTPSAHHPASIRTGCLA